MRVRVRDFIFYPLLLIGLFFSSSVFAQSTLTTSVAALDFGAVTLGKTGAHKLTLINSGGGTDITVTALNFGGPNGGDFGAVAGALPLIIPDGDTLNIIVTFDPGSAHEKDGSLTVVHNGSGGNPLVILDGEGCEIVPDYSATPDPNAPILEQGGKILVEFESQDPPAGQGWTWSEMTDNPAIYADGDTVYEDLTYLISNLNYTVEGGGGAFGTLCYKIQITNPGMYRFKMVTKQGETTRDTTKIDSAFYPEYDPPHPPAPNHENDIWMRVPNNSANVLAVKGNTPFVDSTVNVGNDWYKVFQGDFGWTDNTTTIDEVGLPIFVEFTAVDTFSLCFSVRSKNFAVDKFGLYNINMAFLNVEDPSIPPSPPAIPCPDGFWWYDNDGDSFGDSTIKYSAAIQPIGFANNNFDCDDDQPLSSPALTEILDGIDNNCNGFVDEGFAEAVGPCQEQRFNAGYESTVPYVAASGLEYDADNTILISNSSKNTVPGLAIANTTEDVLYETVRTGTLSKPINYQIPVTNGGYDVILHFAEIYQGVISDTAFVGQSVFHVLLEGDTVLKNFDIYAAAGSEAAATIQLATATVNDGLMNLDLVAVNSGPAINAFELIPQAGCGETTTFPIELLSFGATRNNDQVVLNWETAFEENNDFFTIERSHDARSFIAVGKVNSKGNSQKAQTYQFTDERPMRNTSNFYRLKQTDLDGSFSYSQIVEVGMEDHTFDFFPNPARRGEKLNVYLNMKTQSNVTLQLINTMGQVLAAKNINATAGSSTHQLDLENISQGYYLLALDNGKERIVKKVIVTN